MSHVSGEATRPHCCAVHTRDFVISQPGEGMTTVRVYSFCPTRNMLALQHQSNYFPPKCYLIRTPKLPFLPGPRIYYVNLGLADFEDRSSYKPVLKRFFYDVDEKEVIFQRVEYKGALELGYTLPTDIHEDFIRTLYLCVPSH